MDLFFFPVYISSFVCCWSLPALADKKKDTKSMPLF